MRGRITKRKIKLKITLFLNRIKTMSKNIVIFDIYIWHRAALCQNGKCFIWKWIAFPKWNWWSKVKHEENCPHKKWGSRGFPRVVRVCVCRLHQVLEHRGHKKQLQVSDQRSARTRPASNMVKWGIASLTGNERFLNQGWPSNSYRYLRKIPASNFTAHKNKL